MRNSIAIINYGINNIFSLVKAFDKINVNVEVVSDQKKLKNFGHFVLPGVGSFESGIKNLETKGFKDEICSLVSKGKFIMGICLGMQLLCENTEEGDVDGLGIIKCNVIKFSDKLKVPQMGWNKVKKLRTKLFNKINEGDYMYLVHSYFVPTINETIGQSEYGLTYSVAVQKENFFGVQFHPEKSSSAGSQLLKNFLEL